MSLAARLKVRIAESGPMSVADYMTACLHDPEFGYYATRPRLGADGDFLTAPMVSQMFGELIGLWVADMWARLGRPERFRLVELGPGDGTLMSDALRALAKAPAALGAAELWLIEPSRPLRALQAARLKSHAPRWAEGLAGVPDDRPMILIANEVLDCLPARQFVRVGGGWAERRIGLDAADQLCFGLSPAPSGPEFDAEAVPEGAVLERSAAQEGLASEIGLRVAQGGGAALLIDYGRAQVGFGDTLQAVRDHTKVSPLDTPGEADLTMHADFPAVAASARAAGAAASGPVEQRALLMALGIEVRAASLARARPDRAEVIGRQLARLIEPDQMGALFKALAIHQNGLIVPGFEAPA